MKMSFEQQRPNAETMKSNDHDEVAPAAFQPKGWTVTYQTRVQQESMS